MTIVHGLEICVDFLPILRSCRINLLFTLNWPSVCFGAGRINGIVRDVEERSPMYVFLKNQFVGVYLYSYI